MAKVIRRTLQAAVLLWVLPSAPPGLAEQWMDAATLTEDQLAGTSGRQGLPMQWQVNNAQQNGSVANNVLTGNVVTGDNQLSDGAFEHMNGIATVIQNTGNQVVIQDSTQINILINQ
ncbi:hypothetical protein SAMN05216203_3297 [Marinobacter daqiaonensis]|uniref:Uncharacterized protein n=1 Tax=Marinobacter daqiaonensis TaxID=650891 RepID=A0A1I6JTU5_9GAMM|nr:hypothetical protein [Marinobacter daqiaonensis]SFR82409.1 hypothetical protein SAMN05216203_3297 [Marinobacter daqiaonensis]